MTMMVCLQDDIIDIIAMNASGLWRGACAGRVGNFKFVDLLKIVKENTFIFGLIFFKNLFIQICQR